MLPVAPRSPDYILGPEEPQTPPAPHDEDEHEPMFIQLHDPDFMPEPIYPPEDEHILSAGEHPLPPIVSPTAESPGYVAESDPEEDTEEYKDDETEDSLVDYPMNGGDDGGDDDGDSFEDDADDEDIDEEDKEEEEEDAHLAPADSVVVIPTDELVSPPGGAAISFPPEAKVERLLAMPTPSPSPLTSLSPPSAKEHLARCTAPAALPSPPLPPPLYMPPPVDHRDDILETDMPSQKRLCLSTLGSRYERVDLLMEDRIAHQETIQIVEDEAYAAREAWAHSIGLSQAVHSELQTYQEQGKIKKLEIELWNLKVKENNALAYTKRFQELTLICTKFVADETVKIDKYVSRLPDNIYGSMKASKPKTLDDTIELDNDLMNQKLRTYAERHSNNKRKASESFRNNHSHQHQTTKRQNVTRVYNIGTGEKKPYSGNLPKANPKGNGCFECGATGHFKRDCPKLKNKDGEKVNAPGWVYAVGNAEKRRNASRDPDSNVVTGTFLLNNRYASILFDTGADRSFISNAFSSLIDIVPTLLGNSYDVELANGKIVK
nr:hypothetical protein [Tanacetum cinerariifolium]